MSDAEHIKERLDELANEEVVIDRGGVGPTLSGKRSVWPLRFPQGKQVESALRTAVEASKETAKCPNCDSCQRKHVAVLASIRETLAAIDLPLDKPVTEARVPA